jgi:hypothetical protein
MLRGAEHFQTNKVALLVVVEDDAKFILVALLDRCNAEQNPQHVHIRVIRDFHTWL